MAYHINYAYTCSRGKVRVNNEDNFWCCGEMLPAQNQGLEGVCTGSRSQGSGPVLAVFDGMGGESQGEMAAYLASGEFGNYYKKNRRNLKKDPEGFLKNACQHMNDAVCGYGRQNRIRSMGTTMAMLAFGKEAAYACNLGDSRIYQMDDGRLLQVSTDHVLGSYMFGKAPLIQYLGMQEDNMVPEPSVARLEYRKGIRYLLCSDGLTDMLTDREIGETLSGEKKIEEIVGELADKVLRKGARDNTTIILCEMQEHPPLRLRLISGKKKDLKVMRNEKPDAGSGL